MGRTLERWTREETARLERLWNDGLTSTQIAARFSRSRGSVIGKIHREGLARQNGQARRARNEAIVEKYVEGTSSLKLAKMFGLSQFHIIQIAREYGVVRPVGRPRKEGVEA